MAKRANTILTQNVNKGVGGTRVSREKYDVIREAILAIVPRGDEGILFKNLPRAVEKKLPQDWRGRLGSASWYTTVVKLDLEARRLIERVPGSKPQRLRRIGKG